MVAYSFTNIEIYPTKKGHMIDPHEHFSVDLCSYYTASEDEKVRTVNYILASSLHDRMHVAMLFAQELHSVAQNKVWICESPIDKQHKYEQNLKRIMRQSLVDVGLSIARPSDLLMIVYTVNYIVTILRVLMTWRRNEQGHHLLLY